MHILAHTHTCALACIHIIHMPIVDKFGDTWRISSEPKNSVKFVLLVQF